MNKIIELDNKKEELEICDVNKLTISLLNDSSLLIKILNLKVCENVKITAKVGRNCHLKVVFADFSNASYEVNSCVDLNEEGAECEWHLASLSNNKDNKKFDISFNHNVGHTKALMGNYGVAKDESKIIFSGVNHIKEGAKKSITSQNAKIIVFDRNAIGVASPILKIDENDVKASHAAIVGQLNSDHMFYLMSRGLSKENARQLITLGYLEPISKLFNAENKEKIKNAIEEAI